MTLKTIVHLLHLRGGEEEACDPDFGAGRRGDHILDEQPRRPAITRARVVPYDTHWTRILYCDILDGPAAPEGPNDADALTERYIHADAK